MKKFFATVLGLVLVVAFAAVASANPVDVSGKFTIKGVYDTDWSWGFENGAAFGDITFSKAFGDAASASMTVGLGGKTVIAWVDVETGKKVTTDPNLVGVGGLVLATTEDYDDGVDTPIFYDNNFGLNFKAADYTYKFSDQFALSAAYNVDGFKPYKSPVLEAEPSMGSTVLKGAFTFDGGSFTAYTNALKPITLGGVASYAMDPVTVGGAFLYDGAKFNGGANVAYKVIDTVTVTGDVWYDGSAADFGLKGAYADEMFTANAKFKYTPDMSLGLDGSAQLVEMLKVSAGLNYNITGKKLDDYFVQGDVTVSETVTAYAKYAFDAFIEFDKDAADEATEEYSETDYSYVQVGAAFKLDETNTLKVDYTSYMNVEPALQTAIDDLDNKLAVTLEIAF